MMKTDGYLGQLGEGTPLLKSTEEAISANLPHILRKSRQLAPSPPTSPYAYISEHVRTPKASLNIQIEAGKSSSTF